MRRTTDVTCQLKPFRFKKNIYTFYIKSFTVELFLFVGVNVQNFPDSWGLYLVYSVIRIILIILINTKQMIVYMFVGM